MSGEQEKVTLWRYPESEGWTIHDEDNPAPFDDPNAEVIDFYPAEPGGLREALEFCHGAIKYAREPHHLDHEQECTPCPVAAMQLDLALEKAEAALEELIGEGR